MRRPFVALALATTFVPVALATGCAAPTVASPPPAAPIAEVAPVVEEPPPPPPPPPERPPTPEELATRMAAALDEIGAAGPPPGGVLSSLSALFPAGAKALPGDPDADADDAIVTFKILSTKGVGADFLMFAMEMREANIAACVAAAPEADRKGTLTADLSFDADGYPREPVMKSSTFKDKAISTCVRDVFRSLDPASHSSQDSSTQSNLRATVRVDLERPAGF